MKKIALLIILLCFATAIWAQQDGRIFRTEIVPYDTRHDADARKHNSDGKAKGVGSYITYKPKAFMTENGVTTVGEVVEIPYVWTDGNIYLHLENVGAAYTLIINEQQVTKMEDSATPADFNISSYIKEGKNAVMLDIRETATPQLEKNVAYTPRPQFSGSYLYTQNKRSIKDFTIELAPDSTRKFGVLNLDLIVQNSFNFEEKVTVGYDIYSPQGKLLDYNIVDVVIPGRSTDTVKMHPYIYHTYENKWEAGKAPLYSVMLFLRRDGAYKEYLPLKIGFGKTEFVDGKLTRFDKELKLSKTSYNAAVDKTKTATELKALKLKGFNTICPDYPQPKWFYELCDAQGLYVIDRANINAPDKRTDRTVGGTPSNDPKLRDQYLERVKAMYYRSRNFTCVIAFSLGGESGNGYNMYKAYQWLKSVETSRPIICVDADGEWNSDL